MRHILVTLTVSAAILIAGSFVPDRSVTGPSGASGPQVIADSIQRA